MAAAPLLAVCCGPAVTTWDFSGQNHTQTVEVDLKTFNPDENGGIQVFKPHGDDSVLAGLGLNHNGQVLATCTASTSSDDAPNVALTHVATGTRLESFSNFFPPDAFPAAATSVGFGGKSRYLVLSDASGCASVWDMKKRSRVRTFRLPPPPDGGGGVGGGCTAATIDPSDTLVAAASGWETDGALRLYKLREGKLVATLREPSTDSSEGQSHGGIPRSALSFSPLDVRNVAVGTRDGTVLVWDVETGAYLSKASGDPSKLCSVPTSLLRRHEGAVTGVSFSPVNRVLLASCSTDGSVSFHDANTRRAIQSFRPPAATETGSVGMSCVCFGPDGVTCATGTDSGEVLLYDLRKAGSGPMSQMRFASGGRGAEATSMPVVSVKFIEVRAAAQKSKTPRTERKKKAAVADSESLDSECHASEASKKAAGASVTNSPGASSFPAPKERDRKNAADFDEPLTASNASDAEDTDANEPSSATPPEYVSPIAPVVSQTRSQDQAAPPHSPTKRESPSVSESPPPVSESPEELKQPQDNSDVTRLAVSESPQGLNQAQEISDMARLSVSEIVQNNDQAQIAIDVLGQTKDGQVETTDDIDGRREEACDTNETLSPEEFASTFHTTAREAQITFPSENTPDVKVNKLVLRSMVEGAVDDLREDIDGAMRNLHVDILRQFQQQSDEMKALFTQQEGAITSLLDENRELREENERLRRTY